ncbi:Serine/threonine-protein kinase pkn1 [Candidatus Magnetomorum sp. HK-1]|nr:Serine/threonine-protein kinase pkn1 [Candidatus Magnetomorum sp. HK-1]
MIFNKETWKEKAQNKYKQFKELVTKAGTPVYASVASLALMPLVETAMQSGISSITIPLITLISNLGTNLIATEIEKWKDSNKQISETDIIQWIENTAPHNVQLRNEIDEILIKLDAIPNVQKKLSPDDKQWFLTAFETQLKEMGNYKKYADIMVQGDMIQGDMVQGDKVHLKKDAEIIVMGDVYQNSVVHAPEKKQPSITAKDKETSNLEIAYLKHMLRESGHLSLAGIDKKAASDSEIRLNIGAVYTALLTRTSEKDHDIRTIKPDHEKLQSALELLNNHKKMVLLGDPGSGKTTFVNYVAWCLAGEYCCNPYANIKMLTAPMPDDDGKMDKDKPQHWDHDSLLPVHVVLRDFAARQFGWGNILSPMRNFMLLLKLGGIIIRNIGRKPSGMVDGRRGKLKTGCQGKEVLRESMETHLIYPIIQLWVSHGMKALHLPDG